MNGAAYASGTTIATFGFCVSDAISGSPISHISSRSRIHPGYDGGMRDIYRHYRGGDSAFWNAFAGAMLISCPVVMVVQMFTNQPLPEMVAVATAGATSVLYAVRRMNRRDDPDYAKRPREAPDPAGKLAGFLSGAVE